MAAIRRVFPVERQGRVLLVAPRGDALGIEETQLRREIDGLHQTLGGAGPVDLVVDLSGASYFSSVVLGAVMAMCKRAHDTGGRAVLCSASPGMYDVIQIMKLDAVMPYFPTRDAALAWLQADGAPAGR